VWLFYSDKNQWQQSCQVCRVITFHYSTPAASSHIYNPKYNPWRVVKLTQLWGTQVVDPVVCWVRTNSSFALYKLPSIMRSWQDFVLLSLAVHYHSITCRKSWSFWELRLHKPISRSCLKATRGILLFRPLGKPIQILTWPQNWIRVKTPQEAHFPTQNRPEMPDFAPQLSVKFRESASLQCGRGYIHTTSAAQSTLPGPQSAPLPLTKNANYMPAICAYISDADTTENSGRRAVKTNNARVILHPVQSQRLGTPYQSLRNYCRR